MSIPLQVYLDSSVSSPASARVIVGGDVFRHRAAATKLCSSAADAQLRHRLAEFIALAGPLDKSDCVGESLLPVLPLELNINGLELSLFFVISTFGTPQDITTDELRIEALYPTDTKTEQFFMSMA